MISLLKIKRNSLFFILVIISLSFLGIGLFIKKNNTQKKFTSENICDHCNILLIDIDVLRADELSCFGYFRNTTPNMCNFAKKSLVFKNNFSTSFWTLPSIFSTITSLYPTFHKMIGFGDRFITDNNLPKILKKSGYYTVWLGPDIKNAPCLSSENKGLKDYDIVVPTTNVSDIQEIIEKLPMDKPWFIHYYNDDLHLPYLIENDEKIIDDTMIRPKNLPITKSQFRDLMNDVVKKQYKDIFTKKGIAARPDLFLPVNQEKNDYRILNFFYDTRRTENEIFYIKNSWEIIYDTYINSIDKNNIQDINYLRMMYDTKLSDLDKKLGVVFSKINKNTIVTLMSDHGESFGEHDSFSHQNDYHSQLFHVPLFIYSPKIKSNIIHQTTSNIDIFPTLLELAGIEKINGLQGKPLTSYMGNNKIDQDRFVFTETENSLSLQNSELAYYFVFDSNNNITTELYNKIDDPQEKDNLIYKYSDLARFFYNQTEIFYSYKKQNNLYSLPIDLSQEKIEKIKKQGYF